MKIEQITALKDAGFTAEQIVALAPILTEEPPKPEPPKPEPPKPEPPKPEPEKSPMEEMMVAMHKQFEDMLKAVQGAMINGSRQAETEMTAADVAASILDPGRNRGKK
jgi:hypothetical protein